MLLFFFALLPNSPGIICIQQVLGNGFSLGQDGVKLFKRLAVIFQNLIWLKGQPHSKEKRNAVKFAQAQSQVGSPWI